MTIAGDLQMQLRPFLKDGVNEDDVVEVMLDFLVEANTVSYLASQGCDMSGWYDAETELRAKIIPKRFDERQKKVDERRSP